MSNKLCNGCVKNNNPKSPIAYFVIATVREFRDYEGGCYIDLIRDIEAFLDSDEKAIGKPFYHIYGQRYIDDVSTAPINLGEFDDLEDAKQFIFNLTGEVPNIISY